MDWGVFRATTETGEQVINPNDIAWIKENEDEI